MIVEYVNYCIRYLLFDTIRQNIEQRISYRFIYFDKLTYPGLSGRTDE